MNRNDVIRMAREAHMHYRKIEEEFCKADTDGVPLEMLERFAAAAFAAGAAAEREGILKMSSLQWFKTQADYDDAIRARGQA